MPTEKKSIVPTPTASAAQPRLLSFEMYVIKAKPTQTEGGFEFDILCDERYVGTYPDIYQAIDCAVADLKTSQTALLGRVKNPDIRIHFSVR